ncbi:MAG: hypothetical protein CMI12_05240 [Oceanospirillum sp.]|nr:hypothetical protein [Oceanospirillum sp.]
MDSQINLYHSLDDVISQLYQLALTTPHSSFKESAFKVFARCLKADSGVWLTRAEQQIPFYEQDAFTLNLPEGFMEDYHHLSSVSQQVQQVFGIMLGCLGQTKDILDIVPKDEWLNSDMYRLYCEKYSLHHSLMTISVAPENQLMHIVTLARHDADKPFTTEEKQIKEYLVPSLIGALKVNILNGFQSTSLPTDDIAKNARAVLDHYGNIIEAETGFWDLSQQHQLIHQGKLSIPETLLDGIFEVKGIPFTAQSAHGLLYIQVHNDHKRLLSQRQKQVLELIRQGRSNKEIASLLQITEATVKNHVKSILKLTHCSSRQHLISQPDD